MNRNSTKPLHKPFELSPFLEPTPILPYIKVIVVPNIALSKPCSVIKAPMLHGKPRFIGAAADPELDLLEKDVDKKAGPTVDECRLRHYRSPRA